MSKTGFHNMDMTARNTIDDTSMTPFAYSKMNKTRITFLNILNNRHPCITFTMEKEADGKFPFLDVLVAKKTW